MSRPREARSVARRWVLAREVKDLMALMRWDSQLQACPLGGSGGGETPRIG